MAERTAALERELRVAEELLSDARSRVEGPLLGDSGAVRVLREAIAREAPRSEALLLVGPAGAGKEAVAHAVHAASRRTGAFIFVSCPEAHTASRSAGLELSTVDVGPECPVEARFLACKLELAAGGTLYLDAVHELPVECYPMLEAILRGERVGGDVRVIASTTGDPGRGGHGSRFDALLRALSRHRIAVPALADRREDIPAIVGHFVHRLARQLGKTVTGVSPESMTRLTAYLWPGNIRELRTVLERAIMTTRSSVIEIDEDLLDEGLAVGSYRLVSPLGSGGMGEVWLAKHRLLARPAAVKLIRHDVKQGVPQDQIVRRFQREAQVTAGLRSPHTVQLYDFGVNDTGSFYYVMELLNGFDLHTMITRFGPQPAERVIPLLRQACRSLSEAHTHALVHRDIKPANLFVTCLGPEYRLPESARFRHRAGRTRVGRDAADGTEPGAGDTRVHGTGSGDGGGTYRRARRFVLVGVLRLLRAHRPAALPGKHLRPDAAAPCTDAAGAAVPDDRAPGSPGSRRPLDDVSRKGPRTATAFRDGPRRPPRADQGREALDAGAGA